MKGSERWLALTVKELSADQHHLTCRWVLCKALLPGARISQILNTETVTT